MLRADRPRDLEMQEPLTGVGSGRGTADGDVPFSQGHRRPHPDDGGACLAPPTGCAQPQVRAMTEPEPESADGNNGLMAHDVDMGMMEQQQQRAAEAEPPGGSSSSAARENNLPLILCIYGFSGVRLRQHVLLRRRSWACCQSALSWLWSSALMLASIGFFGWGLWAIFFLHRRFQYPSDIFDGSGGDEIKLLNGCAHPGLGELCAAPIIHDTIFASVGHPFLQMNPEPACCAPDIAQRSWVQAHDNAHCVATECISFFLANPEWATQLGDDGRLKPGLSAAWQWDR